ncbi:MAG: DNA-processing protein DprA [Culturomica sp.]|jgi:predicted Rossmann fold nucleotide-binding protein DprA/Smf involved in DNA uptake|nr:DNA-processing protein DprA [Culturomica sp.]
MNRETAYWMALEHEWICSNAIGNGKIDKMNMVIRFLHEKKISMTDFFQLSNDEWKNEFEITDEQIIKLEQVKKSVPNYAFLAETLQSNGIEVIPIVSSEYSKTLKENLKKSAPLILYIKGNKQIMQENSIAIVGSRDASDIALQFTDNIAKRASKEWKVVISGFAKGVDKQSLDSSIAYKGQSIIVLPQGIMTFESGFKTYYKQIIDGDVLVLSTYHPKAGWAKELAMARNAIIYGLAKEIYAAESKPSKNRQGKETKGGTYAGVMDGLKKGRTIYVRKPDYAEQNDNNLLINSGAIPVDFNGNIAPVIYGSDNDALPMVSEPSINKKNFPEIIKDILLDYKYGLTTQDILKKISSDWKPDKLTKELGKLPFIEKIKKNNKNYFILKDMEPQTLFNYNESLY